MRIALIAAGTLGLLGVNGKIVRDEEFLSQSSRVRAVFLGGSSSDVLPSDVDDDVSREEELAAREFWDIVNGSAADEPTPKHRRKAKVVYRPRGAPIADELGDVAMTTEEWGVERLARASRQSKKVRNR